VIDEIAAGIADGEVGSHSTAWLNGSPRHRHNSCCDSWKDRTDDEFHIHPVVDLDIDITRKVVFLNH